MVETLLELTTYIVKSIPNGFAKLEWSKQRTKCNVCMVETTYCQFPSTGRLPLSGSGENRP